MNFITSYWRELLILVLFVSLSITLSMLYNKPTVTVTIEDTKQIEINALDKLSTTSRDSVWTTF